ncbi:MAG: CorA family divalent cation transporter [Patescibacteria group bacterium]
MKSVHEFPNFKWIDIESPTKSEILKATAEYDIHSLVTEELSIPSRRSKAEQYKGATYLVLHFPFMSKRDGKHSKKPSDEIDFVIGKDFLLTTHYEPIPLLSKIKKNIDALQLTPNGVGAPTPTMLFYAITREFYASLHNVLEEISLRISNAESQIFAGKEREMVIVLSKIHRDLLDLSRAIYNQEDVIDGLEHMDEDLLPDKVKPYIKKLENQYRKVASNIESSRALTNDLRATNDSLLTLKNNETMKYLTIMAFVTFPLSLVSNLFGMNVKNTPIAGSDFDFWIVIVIMVGLTAIMFTFFRHMKWL